MGTKAKLPEHGNRHKETDGSRSGVSNAWRIVASAGVTMQSTQSEEVLKEKQEEASSEKKKMPGCYLVPKQLIFL